MSHDAPRFQPRRYIKREPTKAERETAQRAVMLWAKPFRDFHHGRWRVRFIWTMDRVRRVIVHAGCCDDAGHMLDARGATVADVAAAERWVEGLPA